jgi:sulfur-oxidizing protein SoxZ
MANPAPRVRIPAQARAGETIEVKTLISHQMETGQRRDSAGQVIPRKIIKSFTAKFNGKEIFRSDWHPSVAANPYLAFSVKVPEAGTFEFTWIDDDGSVYKSEHKIAMA